MSFVVSKVSDGVELHYIKHANHDICAQHANGLMENGLATTILVATEIGLCDYLYCYHNDDLVISNIFRKYVSEICVKNSVESIWDVSCGKWLPTCLYFAIAAHKNSCAEHPLVIIACDPLVARLVNTFDEHINGIPHTKSAVANVIEECEAYYLSGKRDRGLTDVLRHVTTITPDNIGVFAKCYAAPNKHWMSVPHHRHSNYSIRCMGVYYTKAAAMFLYSKNNGVCIGKIPDDNGDITFRSISLDIWFSYIALDIAFNPVDNTFIIYDVISFEYINGSSSSNIEDMDLIQRLKVAELKYHKCMIAQYSEVNFNSDSSDTIFINSKAKGYRRNESPPFTVTYCWKSYGNMDPKTHAIMVCIGMNGDLAVLESKTSCVLRRIGKRDGAALIDASTGCNCFIYRLNAKHGSWERVCRPKSWMRISSSPNIKLEVITKEDLMNNVVIKK